MKLLLILLFILVGCNAVDELGVEQYIPPSTESIDNNTTSLPYVNFSGSSFTTSESVGTYSVFVTLSQLSDADVLIPFVISGTAVLGSDYSAVSPTGILNIPAGSLSGQIDFTITDDTVFESSESIILTLQNPLSSSGLLGLQYSSTIFLTDNETVPVFNILESDTTIDEDAVLNSQDITISISTALDVDLHIDYSLTGTATPSFTDDYYFASSSSATGTITIPAGSTSVTRSFVINNDSNNENDESIILELSTNGNALPGTKTTFQLDIDDDETPGQVGIALTGPASSLENVTGPYSFTVTFTGTTNETIIVPYFVTGSATSGADHTLASGQVSISGGLNPSNTISFSIIDDSLFESNEDITVNLGTPSSGDLAVSTATFTITENDTAPEVSFAVSTQDVFEPNNTSGNLVTNVKVKAVVFNGITPHVPITIPFTIGGTATPYNDHNIVNGSIYIPSGQLEGEIIFQVRHDVVDEADETITFAMGAPTNASLCAGPPTCYTTQTITIKDNDDPPKVSFTQAVQQIMESTSAVVGIELSERSEQNVTVDIAMITGTATQGVDYTLPVGCVAGPPTTCSLTIPAGSLSGTLTFPIATDVIADSGESIILTMGAHTNGDSGTPNVHTILTQEDPALPELSFTTATSAVAENAGTVNVSLTLSKQSQYEVKVPIVFNGVESTALLGADKDYTLPTEWDENDPNTWVVTIPPNNLTYNLTLTLVDDAVFEENEIIKLSLGDVSNATKHATDVFHELTINNDEANLHFGFNLASFTFNESAGSINVQVDITGAGGSPTLADRDISIPVNISAGATLTHGSNEDYQYASGWSTDLPAEQDTWRIVIPAGQSNGVATLPLMDDADLELTEDLTVVFDDNANTGSGRFIQYGEQTLTAIGGYGNLNFVANVLDNDTVPTIQFELVNQVFPEAGGSAQVKIKLSGATHLPNVITMGISGSAVAGTDYTAPATSFTIPANTDEYIISIPITSDTSSESDETIILEILSASNSNIDPIFDKHTVIIDDDEAYPAVQFTNTSLSLTEASGTFNIDVELVDPLNTSDFNIDIPLTISGTAQIGDNASTGVDFYANSAHNWVAATPSTYIVTIPAGMTTGSVTININQDASDEPNEAINFIMGTPSNAVIGANNYMQVAIADDDIAPTVTFSSAAQTVVEQNVTIQATVSVSTVSGYDILVPYQIVASGGTDAIFTKDHSLPLSGFVSIPKGQSQGHLNVSIIDDSINEPTEKIRIELQSGGIVNASLGAGIVHEIDIQDNDLPPKVSFSTNFIETTEPTSGSSTFEVTVVLDAPTFRDVYAMIDMNQLNGTATVTADFDYPTSGVAWNTADQTTLYFHIPPGQTAASRTFTVHGGDNFEIDETITLNLLGAYENPAVMTTTTATIGSIPFFTAYILDGGVTPKVSFSAPSQIVEENVGTFNLTANLNVVSDYDIYVPIDSILGYGAHQASYPEDFGYPAGWSSSSNTNHIMKITAGTQTQTAVFSVVNDTLVELTEGIEIRMGDPYVNSPTDNYVLAGDQQNQIVYINADNSDPVPVLNFAMTSELVNESQGSVSPVLYLNQPSAYDVQVSYTVTTPNGLEDPNSDGSTADCTDCDGFDPATPQVDYILEDGVITIPAGQTTVQMPPILILDDNHYERDEEFVITLSSPANATLGGNTTSTIRILNDENLPEILFSLDYATDSVDPQITRQDAFETPGPGQQIKLKIFATGTHVSPMTVSFSMLGGTATISADPILNDFTPPHYGTINTWENQANRTMTIPVGETQAEVVMYVTDDFLYEMDETVIFSMFAPTNATVGYLDTHIISIFDTDPVPEPTFTTTQTLVYEPKLCTTSNTNWDDNLLNWSGPNPSVKQGGTVDCGNGVDVSNISANGLLGQKEVEVKVTVSVVPETKLIVPIALIDGNAVPGVDFEIPYDWNTNGSNWFIELDPFDPGVCDYVPTSNPTQYGSCTVTKKFMIYDDHFHEGDDTFNVHMAQPYLYDPPHAPVYLNVGAVDVTSVTILNDPVGQVVKDRSLANCTVGVGCIDVAVPNDAPPVVEFVQVSQNVSEITDPASTSCPNGRQGSFDFKVNYPSAFDTTVAFNIGDYEELSANPAKSTAKAGEDHDLYAGSVVITAGTTNEYATFCVHDDYLTEGDERIVINIDSVFGGSIGPQNTHKFTIDHSDPIKLDTNANHTCALISGRVKCWGYNAYGQIGIPNSAESDNSAGDNRVTRPQWDFVDLGKDPNTGEDYLVQKVVTGGNHTCAMVLVQDPVSPYNGVKCWGSNGYGQLGYNTSTFKPNVGDQAGEMGSNLPMLEFGGPFPVDVDAGASHTCVVLDSGDPKCFGFNTYGQLGHNNKIDSGSTALEVVDLPAVPLSFTGANQIRTGKYFSCAFNSSTGEVQCWGRNDASELGDQPACDALDNVVGVYDELYPGGSCQNIGDDAGELPGLSTMASTTWANTHGSLTGFATQIVTGPYSTCGQFDTGTWSCFGYMAFNDFGRNPPARAPAITRVGGTQRDINANANVVSYNSEYSFKPDANSWNDHFIESWGPLHVSADTAQKEIRSLDSGYGHTCYNLYDNTVKCRGRNSNGQIGNNSTSSVTNMIYESQQVSLAYVDYAQSVSTGDEYTCVVKKSNEVLCWGRNANGQLGTNNTNNIGSGAGAPNNMASGALLTFPSGKGFAVPSAP